MTLPQRAVPGQKLRHPHRRGFDVTNTIAVSDTTQVCEAVVAILSPLYDDLDTALIRQSFADLEAMYHGKRQGFFGCETGYHDLQHVLDVTLACARLMDGYEQSHCGSEQALGARRIELGILVALFHDSGYIRRRGDTRHLDGAEYTRIHVTRSARFLADYLTEIGHEDWVPLAKKLVQFTGYEIVPDEIELANPVCRKLGYLVGSADLVAQMADADYLNKCRDHLFDEFEKGGVAKSVEKNGTINVVYSSALDLLSKTPGFVHTAIETRLEGYFEGVYRYAEQHFGGDNLYMQALLHNCSFLEAVLAQDDINLLAESLG
ncbi:hypothetical protein SIN8267_03507 [Sinobacterium norvegicum]|uniref:Metal-dependent phosphohydrolase n=1 Tax=Sinobacterium norvegicum TaxID=1641715 RepID=A0ABM9AJE9_9GAMM|nr:hypothetical protein [Sinobacterium norvegicum]CAH0993359.1 hypothetical protein SIN8267_03507 [Sinobacterium norvegicum]